MTVCEDPGDVKMKIDKSKNGGVMVVVPHGSLDINTRKLFQDELLGLVDCGETAILVDLSAVEFITSTGLSALLSAAKRVEEIGGKFAVCSLNDNIRRVVKVSGFGTIFDTLFADEAIIILRNNENIKRNIKYYTNRANIWKNILFVLFI